MINYKLIRSNRKSITITVTQNGEIIVRSPLKISQKTIDDVVVKKTPWINKTLEKNLQRENFSLDGGKVAVLGKEYKIIETDKKPKFTGDAFVVNSSDKKGSFLFLLKTFAFEVLEKRTRYFCSALNLSCGKIKISKARSFWGKCCNNNDITYSVFLILCPENLVDYVIIHELCHTVHKNHGRRFWNLVGSFLPNYKSCRKELKNYNSISGYFYIN